MGKKALILFLLVSGFCSSYAQTQGPGFYIQQGLQNSPLLKDYQNQIQSSTVDSLLITAQRKPQLNGIAQLLVAPSYNGWGYDDAVTNTGNYSAVASASQTLFAKKIYAPQYESVKINKQSIANTSKISEHDLKKSITDQYIAAYTSLNQLQISQATYKLLKDEELLLQEFVQHGIYKQTDYLSFEIALQSQEIQIQQSRSQYKSDLLQLNFICGINDTSYHTLPVPDIQAQLLPINNNSPIFLQFKIDSLKLTNQKELVNAQYKPKLSWFADAGLLTSTPATFYKNFGTSFGLNFSVPIYDGNQKKLQYQKLTIQESTRTSYSEFFKNQNKQHIEQLSIQIKELEALNKQMQKQITNSETLINASKELLNKGDLSVTDFIITIKNYIDVKSQLNQSELKKLELTNELNYWNWQ